MSSKPVIIYIYIYYRNIRMCQESTSSIKYLFICMYWYIHIHIHIHIYTFTYTYTYYIHIYIYIHTYIYIYIYPIKPPHFFQPRHPHALMAPLPPRPSWVTVTDLPEPPCGYGSPLAPWRPAGRKSLTQSQVFLNQVRIWPMVTY